MNLSFLSGIRSFRILNAIGFQLGWWACILSVGYDIEVYAIVFCAGLISAHLFFIDKRRPELRLVGIMLVWGVVMDSLLTNLELIQFFGFSLEPLSPFWLWTIWILFAMTLNWSLSFLKAIHWFYSVLLGGVFGPLSYYSGAKLGAATFEPTIINFLVLGVIWSISMPLLVFISKKNSYNETML